MATFPVFDSYTTCIDQVIHRSKPEWDSQLSEKANCIADQKGLSLINRQKISHYNIHEVLGIPLTESLLHISTERITIATRGVRYQQHNVEKLLRIKLASMNLLKGQNTITDDDNMDIDASIQEPILLKRKPDFEINNRNLKKQKC